MSCAGSATCSGEVRDLDVQLASLASDDADLQGDLTQLRAAISSARARRRARSSWRRSRGSRYVDLLERLVEAARDPAADRRGRSARRGGRCPTC